MKPFAAISCGLRVVAVLSFGTVVGTAASKQPQQQVKPAEAVPQSPAPLNAAATPEPAAEPEPTFYIREYRVTGAKQIPAVDVEKAVYPFMGPGRTPSDVEKAADELEKAYKNAGFPSVSVNVPEQSGRGGIIRLDVVEATIGKVRVRGARYFLPSAIRKQAPSIREGAPLNVEDFQRDLIALNRLPNRTVKPDTRLSSKPGVVDVDLIVEDTNPLSGSLELNNRYSKDTTELRLNGALSYANLFQVGHSFGVNAQIAPLDISESEVYTAFYLMRFHSLPALSLLFQGTKQNSNVSTLGSAAVAGKGEILGVRGIISLPTLSSKAGDFAYTQNLTLGIDYKKFNQDLTLAGEVTQTPVSYVPFSFVYSGTWIPKDKSYATELNAGVTVGLRGLGSNPAEAENNRFAATTGFFYFRGDIAHTQQLPGKAELFLKAEGQLADQPLINSEQIAGGGSGTVRGYLEAEELGDNGIFGTVELRSPSLIQYFTPKRHLAEKSPGESKKEEESTETESRDDWRVYAFLEGGLLTIRKPLPEQASQFELASVGFGTSIQLSDHFNGSVDAAWPLKTNSASKAHEPKVTFRLSTEF